MGLTRVTFMCVVWGLLCHCSAGREFGSEEATAKALQDGPAEPRRHRLQLLFPLLLRISTRLATLVPTALMSLLGILAFVVFSKKALVVSLLALFLTISGKFGAKNDDIYVHKISTYPEYNDEEHIHYHHRGPPKHRTVYHYKGKKRKTFVKKSDPELCPARTCAIRPFKPLPRYEDDAGPAWLTAVSDDWNSDERRSGHV